MPVANRWSTLLSASSLSSSTRPSARSTRLSLLFTLFLYIAFLFHQTLLACSAIISLDPLVIMSSASEHQAASSSSSISEPYSLPPDDALDPNTSTTEPESSSPASAPKSLKRRLSSTESPDLPFFTTASSSFKPKPYAPKHAAAKPPPVPARTQSLTSLPALPLDPSPSEAGVLFIHPPFTQFPGSQNHPEGLTYLLMAEHNDWFLDPTEFVTVTEQRPDVVPYPPQLEPPRGWCPTKKKDARGRASADVWPEGELPRLRCTFCRRTYAGVNAKSMWRRHVYEKHKIAMSNRRETLEKPGSRRSNKENKETKVRSVSATAVTPPAASSELAPESHTRATRPASISISMDAFLDDRPRKTRLRVTSSTNNAEPSLRRRGSMEPPSLPSKEQCDFPHVSTPIRRTRSLAQVASEPKESPSPEKRASSPEICVPSESDIPVELPSPLRQAQPSIIPPSPYDPTATPSFRHSTPQLPSKQPWRYHSPSHPLHSQARELPLSVIALKSPHRHKILSTPLGGNNGNSPAVSKSRFASSNLNSSPVPAFLSGSSSELNTPNDRSGIFGFTRSPRDLLGGTKSKGSPLPLKFRRVQDSSPFSFVHAGPRSLFGHLRDSASSDWLTEITGGSPARGIPLSDHDDPFGAAFSSQESSIATLATSLSLSGSQDDSPVVRHGRFLPPSAGMGLGLLEPIKLDGDDDDDHDSTDFDVDMLDGDAATTPPPASPTDEKEEEDKDEQDVESAPTRRSFEAIRENDDLGAEGKPPMKRRKTICT